MPRIPLTGKRGGFTLVDPVDLPLVQKYKWNHSKIGYAARYINVPQKGAVLLHREILGFPRAEVDHINGNKLDNRRKNLRICSRRSNATNSGSRYPRGRWGRNVTRVCGNRKRPFLVTCWMKCKQVHGGYFATPEQAQKAASKLRKKLDYFA